MITKHHKIIKDLTKMMGFKVELEIIETESDKILNIKTEDSSLLIGRGGENLKALEHISSLILYHQSPDEAKNRFLLDINGYRQSQKQILINIAQDMAEKVLRTNRPEVLRPMTAYERKTVHLELAKNPAIMTESIGDEPNRRIVVKIKK